MSVCKDSVVADGMGENETKTGKVVANALNTGWLEL